MKLTPKDTVGLLLVAGTLGALYVHIGPEGHASKHPSSVADAGGPVAFVNVNVLPRDRDGGVLRNQVVIVEGGLVQSIGPFDEVELPDDALIIYGDGTKYLVPGLTHTIADRNASFGTVTRHARADLILLDGHPVSDVTRLGRPSGVMLRGEWYDGDALDRMLAEAAGSR